MSAAQLALLFITVVASSGLLSCDSPRDPPKPPRPVTAVLAAGMPAVA